MSIEKVPSGTDGLDRLLEGGFPLGRVSLIKGSPGTGKSTLGAQFLIKGAELGEKSLIVIAEENPNNFILDFEHLNIKKYVTPDLINIFDSASARIGYRLPRTPNSFYEAAILTIKKSEFDNALIELMEYIKREQTKRLVIDSIQSFLHLLTTREESKIRDIFYKIVELCRQNKTTTLLISELTDTIGNEYIVDGIIELGWNNDNGKRTRYLYIEKMRGCKHDTDIHRVEITNKGLRIIESILP
ncbi:MAG: RAD55 family ATPase [Candidatus Helarchaeota archaeon]